MVSMSSLVPILNFVTPITGNCYEAPFEGLGVENTQIVTSLLLSSVGALLRFLDKWQSPCHPKPQGDNGQC